MMDTLTSPLALAQQHTIKSKAPEFYGLTAWILTYIAFVLYILWAILPDAWIVACGITWYPSREWAVLVPAWTVVTVLLTYIGYFSLALYNTPALSDLATLADSHAIVPEPNTNPYLDLASPYTTPDMMELPIGLVNRVLYSSSSDGSRPFPGYDTAR